LREKGCRRSQAKGARKIVSSHDLAKENPSHEVRVHREQRECLEFSGFLTKKITARLGDDKKATTLQAAALF
tara:strand:+ start:422 stop:637 length:216 start_codon:yes stop_codon:yes gene_type:complete